MTCCLRISRLGALDGPTVSTNAHYFRILDAGRFLVVCQCMPLAMLVAVSLAVKKDRLCKVLGHTDSSHRHMAGGHHFAFHVKSTFTMKYSSPNHGFVAAINTL